jgi:riboflavin synthase
VFSGIIETTARVLHSKAGSGGVVRICIEKPRLFEDLNVGDSVAVNGVCLTVESWDDGGVLFALGAETLRVTGWTSQNLPGQVVNLERSLRLGDRLHGHLVTGHVDARAGVVETRSEGEGLFARIAIPESLTAFIWPKGSVAVDGVSLTINQVSGATFTIGLIPETLKRTNLKKLRPGLEINLEVDNMARGFVHWADLKQARLV